ncbi:protein-disulfide reductase DsbD [Nitrincola tapanii]|uniref:Thiol:disulfide interchange protein DsbD n=1 Tax=Nitrincola tapanii TaxID=1708751 RepID=A0A5A9W5F1_9GAMM|nr:protein-disulfide reductase DsbD [Nitrincola tapanii]KAA0875882.1 protein-disulfide reductase DsbD [Nitrincola tapanii]
MKVFARLLLSLLILSVFFSTQAHSSLFGSSARQDGPLPVEEAFKFDAELSEEGVVKLYWQISEGYYLYRDHLKWQLPDELVLVEAWRQAGVAKEDPLFGQVEVWYQSAEAALLIGQAGSEQADLSLNVTYQGCWEGGICYPPVTETLDLPNLPLAAGLDWPASWQPPEATSVELQRAPGVSGSEHDRFRNLLAGESLLFILGAFFLAGLALSFTPCVFPMIPILSSIIAGQEGRVSTARALGLSSVYVLAMALTYTLAGVLAGLFGANLQASFQNPWIISIFSGLFVLLALSMFGFYELQLPNRLQTLLSQKSHQQQGGQVWGVAIMGFLSALIVGPCMAAPLAGALIYIGQTGDPFLGGAALFALSIGMGVPLLLVGTSAGKLLPRAGAWMKGIKAGFGVMLLLLAVWMLDRIVPVQITMLLTAIILIITAIYMNALERLDTASHGITRLLKGLGLILLVYGIALLLGVFSGGRSLVYPLQAWASASSPGFSTSSTPAMSFVRVTERQSLEALLADAKKQAQPVMLDFYADWCVTCAEMEEITFRDAAVQQRLDSFMRIKVDVTRNDAEVRALNRQYQVFGPPALVFFDSQGRERTEFAVHGVIAPEPLLEQIAELR